MQNKTATTKPTQTNSTIADSLREVRERLPTLNIGALSRLADELGRLTTVGIDPSGLTDAQARDVRDLHAAVAAHRSSLVLAHIAASLRHRPAAVDRLLRVAVWDDCGCEVYSIPTDALDKRDELILWLSDFVHEASVGWVDDDAESARAHATATALDEIVSRMQSRE